jgi:nitroreductase
MSGEPLTQAELNRLLEAARWAPSSFNHQPWRFVYALGGTPAWHSFFELLVPFNQLWCKDGGALIVVCAKTVDAQGNPNPLATFDAGAAAMSIALQASAMGLVFHALGGVEYAKIPEAISLPADHSVCCMLVAGRPGPVSNLPDFLQPREAPSDRNPIESFAFEATFAASK